MSGKSVAERVERLRYLASSPYVPSEVEREMNFAADHLAELEAEVETLEAEVETLEPRIQSAVQKVCDRFNMFRPPCSTCGGTHKGAPGMGVDGQRTWAPCPDCPPDGKVPIERLAADWLAQRALLARLAQWDQMVMGQGDEPYWLSEINKVLGIQ